MKAPDFDWTLHLPQVQLAPNQELMGCDLLATWAHLETSLVSEDLDFD